jgi:hypothetical protein
MKWEKILKRNCGCGKDPCETYGEVKKAPPLTSQDEQEIQSLMRFRNMSREEAEKSVRRKAGKNVRGNTISHDNYMRFHKRDKINPDYKKGSSLKIKQYQAMLRMTVGKYGKDSEQVEELGTKFMATKPSEKEIDEIMDYFESLEDKPKEKTPMDELREKQKRAKAELDSKRDR